MVRRVTRRLLVARVLLLVALLSAGLLFMVPAMSSAQGDADVGRALFTGERSFTNGGPPCISCHNAGRIGALGGGTLGPDLTKVWEQKPFLLDPNWINSEGVPVMGPIFSRHKVTDEEVEHLKAFFSAVASESPAGGGGKFLTGGIIGSIVMLVFFSIIWSNRYRKRCQGTAHDALWRKLWWKRREVRDGYFMDTGCS